MPSNSWIYLDYNATTPCDARVVDAMLPYLSDQFANPASTTHEPGRSAQRAVDHARDQVAQLIGAKPDEIVFVSGATESANLALCGLAGHYRDKGRHIITTSYEHKAVLSPCHALENAGFDVTYVEPNEDGAIDPSHIREALRADTILVSVIHAHNELGTINDVATIGQLCHEAGVLFHTDATQSAGKIAIDVEAMHIDLLSLSAHKMYGPKGAGVLWRRSRGPRVRLMPMITGGGHEQGLRAGTLNVPAIVGLGCACDLAREWLADAQNAIALAALRDRLEQGFGEHLDAWANQKDQKDQKILVKPNAQATKTWNRAGGKTSEKARENASEKTTKNALRRAGEKMGGRLCQTSHFVIPGLDPAVFFAKLEGLAVSAGSACSSSSRSLASLDASRFAEKPVEQAQPRVATLRVSLGRPTTADEVEQALVQLGTALRASKPG